MDQSRNIPAWIGIACTWVGAAVGVFAVTALAAGLKASISPDAHEIVLFKGILGPSSIVALGVSAALMVGGAWLGRARKRRIAEQKLIASSTPNAIPRGWPQEQTPQPQLEADRLSERRER
jgi:hypothetical protein